MAKRARNEIGEPDDIELLNVHRYPESVPPALLAHVRNSKGCQNRLQELLKTVPNRRPGRFVREAALSAEPAAEGDSSAPSAAPESAWGRIRRYLLG